MSRTSRRLFLHVSALSDTEFSLYVSALQDILNDGEDVDCTEEELENTTMGVREVRAWMRGRYPDVADLDKILRYFCSTLAPNDTMTGGQLFAALRLIMHVRKGAEPAEGLVFVQAPTDVSPPGTSRPQPSPSSASRKLPDSDAPSVSSEAPSSESLINPFRRESDPPPIHPGIRRASLARSDPPPVRSVLDRFSSHGVPAASTAIPAASVPSPSSNNPFLQRPKPQHNASEISGTSSLHTQSKIPPLPPRKPAHVTAASLSHSHQPLSPSILPNQIRPPVHPLGASQHSHSGSVAKPISTSVLMKQSLQASKTGLSLKRAQEQLEKERVLEVIQSSSSLAGYKSTDSRSRSRSPDKVSAPRLPTRRPVPSPPLSTATSSSAASLEQIAGAALSSKLTASPNQWLGRTTERLASPERLASSRSPSRSVGADTQAQEPIRATSPTRPPPTHPDRKPPPPPPPINALSLDSLISPFESPISPDGVIGTSRPTRSKSLHHPSPTSSTNGPPAPPPRRRRPESVQVSPLRDGDAEYMTSPFANVFAVGGPGVSPHTPNGGLYSPSKLGGGHSRSYSNLTRHSSLATNPSTPQQAVSSAGASPMNFNSLTSSAAAGQNLSAEPESLSHALTSSIQKTLNQLQPKLDRARYKAEAGLSRRGFVQHRGMTGGENEQGLMDDAEEEEYADKVGKTADEYPDLGIDSLQGGDESTSASEDEAWVNRPGMRGRRVGGSNGIGNAEIGDNMKFPIGGGWAQL